MSNVNALIYAEDPGAANYIAHLPAALAAQNIVSILLTNGLATDYLKQRQISSQPVGHAESALAIIEDYHPQLVIVGTSENVDSFGLKLIKQAQLSGIPSVGVIDLGVNADRRFRGRSDNPLEHAPDWLLVPDAGVKSVYELLGFRGAQIVVCGHPHYDYIRQVAQTLRQGDQALRRSNILPDAPEDRPVVVFVAEPASILNPVLTTRSSEYTLLGRGDSDWRTEIVLQEFLDAFSVCERAPYLVLRLHPKNNVDEFSAYQKAINHFSTGGDPLQLISVADFVVGMTSMLLLEAALMDKLTLSIVPRACEKSWLPSIMSGVTPSVSTRAELRKAIAQWFGDWQARTNGKPITSKQLPNTKDVFPEGSLDRVVKFVVGLMSKAKATIN